MISARSLQRSEGDVSDPIKYIYSQSAPDQEYMYFMGSETLPSACYKLSDESSIPFYSTSSGYNKWNVQQMFFYLCKLVV